MSLRNGWVWGVKGGGRLGEGEGGGIKLVI